MRRKVKLAFCCAGYGLFAAAPAALAVDLIPGINVGAAYIQDYIADVSGGHRQGSAAPGKVDLSAAIDGRAWGGSTQDLFFFDYMGTVGGSISNDAGDIQGLDNIEAFDTTKVFSAWYQHRFGDSGLSVRLGLQDYNALFDVLDTAGVFINSSFGLDPTVAQADVSTFPTTSVGAVARWQSGNGLYVMGGAYDGTPGLPGHQAGTHIDFRSGDGVFAAAESGITGGGAHPYKLALGGWFRTSRYQDPAGRRRDRSSGFYVIGERRLWGRHDKTPRFDAFFQLGIAASNRNLLNRYLGAGINVTGMLPARPDDIIGVGVARAHTSSTYRAALPTGARTAETAVELTYQAPINDHVFVQPDIQYIMDPGADRQIGNATIVGLRAGVQF